MAVRPQLSYSAKAEYPVVTGVCDRRRQWNTGSPAFAGDDIRCASSMTLLATTSRGLCSIQPCSNFKQQIHIRVLAAPDARGLGFVVPRTDEGAGNAGCALHPRSRVQGVVRKIAHEHTGQRRRSDIPCAMALRLISRSSRSIGLSCLRRLTETGTPARLGLRASERLDANH